MTPANGSLLLYHSQPSEPAYDKLVDPLEELVTGSPWTHVERFFSLAPLGGQGAFAVGATLWTVKGKDVVCSGVRLRPWPVDYDLLRQPVQRYTGFEISQMWYYAMMKLWQDKQYSVAHLVADAALVPLRRFFSHFESQETAGLGVCSSFQAELELAAFRYPFGDLAPATLTPGDFATSPAWRDL
jgi:hypothetical protein